MNKHQRFKANGGRRYDERDAPDEKERSIERGWIGSILDTDTVRKLEKYATIQYRSYGQYDEEKGQLTNYFP